MNRFKYLYLAYLSTVLLFASDQVFAVPPPDFIIQAASQIGSFFAVALALSAGIFSIFLQFVRGVFINNKVRFWLVSLAILMAISWIWAYAYDLYYQQNEREKLNQQWIEEVHVSPPQSTIDTLIKDGISNQSTSASIANGIRVLDNSGSQVQIASGSGSTGVPADELFYFLNQGSDRQISNSDFARELKRPEGSYTVLDARENLEYDLGHMSGSLHIRFADLKAGRWAELPKDRFIYVLCWSGIRGKEVAEFLDSKKIAAKYLENGANGWVDFWGKWEGKINFNKVYNQENYRLVFTPAQLLEKSKRGVMYIDSRGTEKYSAKHRDGAVSIPMLSTPTSEIESVFAQVPKGSRVIVVCDGYVNCFDARLTGIELEKRGVIFLGRFWES